MHTNNSTVCKVLGFPCATSLWNYSPCSASASLWVLPQLNCQLFTPVVVWKKACLRSATLPGLLGMHDDILPHLCRNCLKLIREYEQMSLEMTTGTTRVSASDADKQTQSMCKIRSRWWLQEKGDTIWSRWSRTPLLTGPTDYTQGSYSYGLPQIHKLGVTLRPIVNMINTQLQFLVSVVSLLLLQTRSKHFRFCGR